MADSITVEIHGLQQLGRALNSIPAVFSTRIMREALHAAGEVIKVAAEATAPVRTGALKADIITKVHVGNDLSNNYVLIGPGYERGLLKVRGIKRDRHGKVQPIVRTTDSPGVYGKFVETGHKLEFGSSEVPPHPWLRPAFEASKQAAVEVFIAYVRAGLEAVAAAVRGS